MPDISDNQASTSTTTEPNPPATPKRNVLSDHTFAMQEGPRSLKRKLDNVCDKLATVSKKLKYKSRKVKRLQQKVSSLTAIVADLKKQNLISGGCEALLKSSFSDVPLAVLQRILQQKGTKISRSSYPEVLRSFALTLSFYSLKAYNYVRKTFKLALPHPSTIRQWYSGINGEPGFTSEAFSALSLRASEDKEVVCSLMVDEMAIKKAHRVGWKAFCRIRRYWNRR